MSAPELVSALLLSHDQDFPLNSKRQNCVKVVQYLNSPHMTQEINMREDYREYLKITFKIKFIYSHKCTPLMELAMKVRLSIINSEGVRHKQSLVLT